MAIFLLVSWLAPASFASQQVDIIEFFAGTARIARLGKAAGWNVLAHDLLYDRDKGKTSCMNMCGAAGYALPACIRNVICGLSATPETSSPASDYQCFVLLSSEGFENLGTF